MKTLISTAVILSLLLLATIFVFAFQSGHLGGEPFALLEITKPQLAEGNPIYGQNKTGEWEKLAHQSNRKSFSGGKQANQLHPSEGVVINNIEKMPIINGDAPINPIPSPENLVRSSPKVPSEMVTVPVKELVEYSKYGLLPKVSADGRKPRDIYARAPSLPAQSQPGEPARIAILINGMGQSTVATQDAIKNLPASVTLAFGPYGNNLQGWIRMARESGHEVMLQIPLEPYDYPDNDPGPHTLLTSLPVEENIERLKWLMARFTGYVGLTNSMGEKFVAANDALRPIMNEIKQRGLIYVDSTNSARSASLQLANELGVGYGAAEVVIDSEETKENIDKALTRLETIAQERGLAFGLGSNSPLTIKQVSDWAKSLEAKGIVLVPVSAMVRARQRT